MTDISDIRREYTLSGNHHEDMPDDPVTLFTHWLEVVKASEIADPTAMSVATVDETGQPFQRIVLLKRYDEQGFIFFTNLGSRKAQQIEGNAKVSLLFPWQSIDKQVAITGVAELLSKKEVLKYFISRPKESQIAAWVSKQSSPISTRQVLESKFNEFKAKFANGDVPLPHFWGGYRVRPSSIEFWQGGENRLHDRFIYTHSEGNWGKSRLAP
ncbi:pyridoxamine 5'-phosphate oxidase [Shewanella surugensis]|uniref:Pyridoxine/pyridoxamine 5'-phosphate oxidase n=1 Tax=Shewanella surugensis TaxID=212020 RepID=A0ABT0LF44_9GAMM|nr:pyridoxamine 5'-phosphate oxidase [Shewanella surugensis]MCL1126174.1 pyridoxamine 5'-phosphate oxidase [Shewanella surugensis]